MVRLHLAGEMSLNEVIAVETDRLRLGIDLSDPEQAIALLLSDETERVVDLLAPYIVDPPQLEGIDTEVWIWLEIMQVRNQWDALIEPSFYIEEILDRLDKRDSFQEIRFFRQLPRKKRGFKLYVKRLDTTLNAKLVEFNRLP